jgi:hypothetical protein
LAFDVKLGARGEPRPNIINKIQNAMQRKHHVGKTGILNKIARAHASLDTLLPSSSRGFLINSKTETMRDDISDFDGSQVVDEKDIVVSSNVLFSSKRRLLSHPNGKGRDFSVAN